MMTDQQFGAKIRALRERKKLSQQELAVRLGLKSDTAVYLIEKGERGVSLDKLKILAELFDITVSELVEDAAPKQVSDVVTALRSEGLTEKDVDQVSNFIKFIKQKATNDK